MNKEEELEGYQIFVDCSTRHDLAEFIQAQSDAIDGLTINNKSFIKAFHRDANLSCEGCENLLSSYCILKTGNHCVRRAEDYYKKKRKNE